MTRKRPEERNHRRFDVQDVEGTFLANMRVNVLNLSLAGMAMETTHPLHVGKRYSFRIDRLEEPVNVTGTVAWCVLRSTRPTRDGEAVPVYHAGVHFGDVITDTAQELRQLIEHNVVLSLDKRVFGRFRLAPGTYASFDTEVKFEVRRISLSGMLVETPLIADLDTRFPVEIHLVNGLFRSLGRVAYLNDSASAQEDPERTVELGVEFLEVAPVSRERLEEFIAFTIESEPEDG